MRLCSIDGCTNQHMAKGLCKLHYSRNKRGTPLGSERVCKSCSSPFLLTRGNRECCSQDCARDWWFKKQGPGYNQTLYRRNPERFKKATIKNKKIAKDKCYNAYGGYVCACCGVIGESFLTLDHINNDGAEHRKLFNPSALYRWIIRNNFPAMFQVLCWNCNCGKNMNGGVCPHKDESNGLRA